MNLIGVTGASGKMGRAAITYLLQREVAANSIVAVVRDPSKVADLTARGVQARQADYTDPASLESAFRGINKLLFISSSALGEERMLHHRNVVKAARAAAVRHIVYTSVIKPAVNAKFAPSPGHFHTEALIRDSGIPYTFFRNNLYLDIIPLMFDDAVKTGAIVHNGGSGRIGFIAREDIARALAAVLTDGDQTNRVYPITAVAPYSLNDVASAFTRTSGRSVTYTEVSSDGFRKALQDKGLPEPVVEMSVALGEAIRAGEFDAGSPDLERLIDRAPVTLEPFLRRAAAYNDGRRVFLAGASGVIGQRLIPRLVQAGHVVGGLTRSIGKTKLLTRLGAEPILCDVFDREALIQAVRDFKPDVVLDELTDLPDDAARISELADLNARIRTEGTRNVIEAARQSGSPKILAQSVAWQLPDGPDAKAVAELERAVLAAGGVVLRYGQFYGPGTYNEQQPPEGPRVHIDRAAERTVEALGEPTGVVSITD